MHLSHCSFTALVQLVAENFILAHIWTSNVGYDNGVDK